jgi:PHS family inorganic phosphate transporter-like MFS transporter
MADQGKLNDPVVETYSAHPSPVIDPNERRRQALEQIDNAEFGWRHVRACVVAGVGFFTDAYDIFAINMASAMLGVVFWVDTNKGRTVPTTHHSFRSIPFVR